MSDDNVGLRQYRMLALIFLPVAFIAVTVLHAPIVYSYMVKASSLTLSFSGAEDDMWIFSANPPRPDHNAFYVNDVPVQDINQVDPACIESISVYKSECGGADVKIKLKDGVKFNPSANNSFEKEWGELKVERVGCEKKKL